MPCDVVLKPAARRDVKSISKPGLIRFAAKIDALANDPRPPGAKVLEAKKKLMRIHSGDYRITYEIQDERLVVLVIRIGHRREIHQKLKRKRNQNAAKYCREPQALAREAQRRDRQHHQTKRHESF